MRAISQFDSRLYFWPLMKRRALPSRRAYSLLRTLSSASPRWRMMWNLSNRMSSANSSFSANTGIVKKLSSDLINLDHVLRIYGPEANAARAALRAYAAKKNEELFPATSVPTLIE